MTLFLQYIGQTISGPFSLTLHSLHDSWKMHAHFSALTRPSFHINNNVGDIRFSDSVVHDLRL